MVSASHQITVLVFPDGPVVPVSQVFYFYFLPVINENTVMTLEKAFPKSRL